MAAIEQAGGRAFALRADVADEAQVLALFAEALPRLGGLDILVNCAGILFEKPLLDTSVAGFRPADRRQPARHLPGRTRGLARHGRASAAAA